LAVIATTLLPDRTVVHTSANTIASTTYATSFGPVLMFALVAGTAAYAGLLTRRHQRGPIA
jgi:hypothetical protein